jgi:hypothetical protein
MTITSIWALPVGNALRVYITPPACAVYWRVLRRTADAFTGPDDAGAVVVVDGSTDNAVLDTFDLVNGTTYFYRDYAWVAGAWVDPGVSDSGTPSADYQGDTIDPQSIVRERVELGLAVEVARGALKPASSTIPVLTAPFALADGVTFPVVSVHFETGAPAHRGLGEVYLGDMAGVLDSNITATEGWLERTVLKVVGVSQNSDERIALRQALLRVIQANLPVFNASAMIEVEFSQADTEQFTEKNVPLYFTEGTFVCLSPAFVQDQVPAITDVTVTLPVTNL